jgi:hypothetical protein
MMRHFLLITIYFWLIQSSGLQLNSDLGQRPRELKPSAIILPDLTLNGTTLETFTEVTITSGMSGGIARVLESCTQGLQKPLHIKAGMTLSQALDAVAGNDTRSDWQTADGVVNMLPVGSLPPLLQVRIHSFKWDKNAPAAESIARLRDSLAVVERAKQLGLEMGPFEGGPSGICIRNCSDHPKPQPAWQIETDQTLRTLLNRIVQAHQRAIWAYSENHCGNSNRFLLETIAQ